LITKQLVELDANPERQVNTADTLNKIFGTKAETLACLQPVVRRSKVADLVYFTVKQWREDDACLLGLLTGRFDGQSLVVRSSAQSEDGSHTSMAGAFKSCLDVPGGDLDAVRRAVEQVISSYLGNPHDQVLVQAMLRDVKLSGVIMTHDLASGAPYYILNYDDESGKTDTITGGTGVNKTVVVHREFSPGYIESPRVAMLLEMIRELEGICGRREPLDVEFAQTRDGQLYLLQARRITVQKNWNRRITARIGEALYQIERFFTRRAAPRPGLAGARTVLGQMPDWNPAEIIGTHPRPLAVSLYRALVTDSVWQEARASMGYRAVPDEVLMVTLGGVPYIDVRNSFNSFLPAGLPESVQGRLVEAWLARLAKHPELHDKVEFEVAQTVVDFNFEPDHLARYTGVLTAAMLQEYRHRLSELTARNISVDADASLPQAIRQTEELERRQGTAEYLVLAERNDVRLLRHLLAECRDLGTRPFAIIARHAFIAEALFRSAVARGAFQRERLDEFKNSLTNVTTRFASDFVATLDGTLDRAEFLRRYGHLRPGTYDILSLRYDQRVDLFNVTAAPLMNKHAGCFSFTDQERAALVSLFREAGLDRTAPENFLEYARLAITHREEAKFIFTRHLSNMLELIANWGEELGLTREDLSFFTLDDILATLVNPILDDNEVYLKDLAEDRRRHAAALSGIRLGYIIRDVPDIYVVPLHRSAPNFVSSKKREAPIVQLDARSVEQTDLFEKIVCIENADPGFDWIFTRGIAGLVSKFGGANSHMTIRCAELGLPAAIGVGEQTFERLIACSRIELDCAAKIVRPIYG
jgi:hypothetical protein